MLDLRSFIAALLLMLCLPVAAEPVAEHERVPIDLRRTTLIVSDIENSLRFYRDALGFRVIYDQWIRNPRTARNDEESTLSRRLVFVRANDDYIGIIGLLQYTKPVKAVREPEPAPFSTGSAVLLFTAEDVDARFERASRVPGVRVIHPPADVEYPSHDGGEVLEVRTSQLYDPDGFLVELNAFRD